jgi:hypothetical protein
LSSSFTLVPWGTTDQDFSVGFDGSISSNWSIAARADDDGCPICWTILILLRGYLSASRLGMVLLTFFDALGS